MELRRLLSPVAGLVLLAAISAGCNSDSAAQATGSDASAQSTASGATTGGGSSTTATVPTTSTTGDTTGGTTGVTGAATAGAAPASNAPAQNGGIDAPPKAGDQVAVLNTDDGVIVIKFLKEKAANTVDNFIKLAKKGYFDGTKFHRTMPGFMIQGGDPNSKSGDPNTWGQGGPGYTIADEFSDVDHVRGVVSMANTGQPNSGGSQFFIVVKDSSFLNGKYSAFGYVVQGMSVADKIVARPSEEGSGKALNPATVKSVKIETWPLKS